MLKLTKSSSKANHALCAAILLSFAVSMPGAAAQSVDPEWPCVQALVPEVALGVLWPNPIEETQRGEWRKHPEISSLSEALGDIDAFTEKQEKLIEDFVQSQPESELTESLNQLADGVVSVANRLRTRYIKGIKRYTRQQISIASQIEQSLNEVAALGEQQTPERTELEEALQWHERVYDQREQAIISLCERPVELEEKLSSVMRHLSMFLP